MKKTFTGRSRLFLSISGAIIVVALLLQICGLGLNLGIDFTGGSILEYSVGEDYDVNDVETILASVGYGDAQVTKAAPSAASVALQENLAAEEAAPVEEAAPAEEAASAEETAEATEEAAEATEEAAEATEEAAEEVKASLLTADKSGVKVDGLTDLQVRLNLVDEASNMEKTAEEAVKSVVADAKQTQYTQLTFQAVNENDYDATYTGGYAIEFDMGAAFDLEAVKAAVEAKLNEGYSINSISVEAYAPEEGAEATALRVLVDMNDVTSQVRSILEREMSAKYPKFHFVSIDHVSAIAGRDLLSNAVKALLIAFACMLIYIAIRFDALSGLAALFALLHDVLIMVSVMIFVRAFFQINSSFIAAVLTIVGYSINNTIIIFDRIRENNKRPGMTQMAKMDIVEVSVSSTLARTINTTVTTMITLVCLYIFGVESIREFAFPLIVGMLAGTYSSVLLSGQVWAMWSEKLAARKEAAKAKK